jgi:hypothetical protein
MWKYNCDSLCKQGGKEKENKKQQSEADDLGNQTLLYIYVWKLNQTVIELDFRAVKFLFFPQRDLNPHHWYTAAPFA